MAWQAGTGQHRAAGARRYRHAARIAGHARAARAWQHAHRARTVAGAGGRRHGLAWCWRTRMAGRRTRLAVRLAVWLAVRLGAGPYAGPGRHAAPHGGTGR